MGNKQLLGLCVMIAWSMTGCSQTRDDGSAWDSGENHPMTFVPTTTVSENQLIAQGAKYLILRDGSGYMVYDYGWESVSRSDAVALWLTEALLEFMVCEFVPAVVEQQVDKLTQEIKKEF